MSFWMFADDLKVAKCVRGQADVDAMQEMLVRLYRWCSDNRMQLNIKKCSVMTYHRIKSPILAHYRIDGQLLARRDVVSDLGVTFEKDLGFISHIN
ncbi:hypothetical protein M8J77_025700 [Diaphorina citri]|nr:hypothetical protein M8J77_014118 [Diaphorina citri]KAI5718709.1 hypothetical protein M8J77_025700 [Diaphorina citri]